MVRQIGNVSGAGGSKYGRASMKVKLRCIDGQHGNSHRSAQSDTTENPSETGLENAVAVLPSKFGPAQSSYKAMSKISR